MKAKVTKAFKFAIGGNHVVDVEVGQVVDGRCAEVALEQKWGVPHEDKPAPIPVSELGGDVVEHIEVPQVEEPAPEAKPQPKPSKTKGR